MRFVLSSATLSTHLMTIGRVIVQKNNIPILDCFCFDIKGKELTITASDNDSTLTTTIQLNESDADVRFAVNAKTIQDAIKELPEQPLEFYLNTDTYELVVDYQNGQYKLIAQDADEYPVPVKDEANRVTLHMGAERLCTGVSRALIAAANDVLRPQLNTVCFDIKEKSVSMVASNGNHLALTKEEVDTNGHTGSYLLNTRPAGLLRGILAKDQGDVEMSFGERDATFTSAEYTLSCRLVEGRYPNYQAVIPKDNPNIVTVNRGALISVLRRVLIFANPSAVLVKLRLENSSLNISSQDIDFGKSAEETMLCDYSGSPLQIAFKGSVLLELIQNIDGEEISLKLSDPSRAGVIVPTTQQENEEVLMLLMPSVFKD